jgi:hypothetical protein
VNRAKPATAGIDPTDTNSDIELRPASAATAATATRDEQR